MKLRIRKSTAAIAALSMITVGSSIYAADYQYDELNRVTSVEKEGKTTSYTYDAGGNLLSATSSDREAVEVVSSSLPTGDVIAGWTAYKTQGMEVHYETASVDGNEQVAPSEEIPAAEEEAPVEEAPAEEEAPVEEAPTAEEEAPSEDTPAAETKTVAVQMLRVNADRTGGANIYRDMAVQGGVGYTYQGQVKSGRMQDAVVQVVVNYYDNQQRLITYDNVLNLKQDTDWTSYAANLTAPSDAVKARVHLQVIVLKANGQAEAGFADRTFEHTVSQGGQQ